MTVHRSLSQQLLRIVLGGFLLMLPTGCGSSNAQFTPRGDEAKVALEKALSAWRDGQPIDKLESTPPVRVVDSGWRDGQRIEKFEILSEHNGDDGTKVFDVKLSSKKPQGDHEFVYVVYGRDPIWVYREDDYNRILRMDNNPVKAKSRPGRRPRGG